MLKSKLKTNNKHLRKKLKDIFPKIYIVSLQKNTRLKKYYEINNIKGAKFLEITKKNDFKKISKGDMYFLITSKKINGQTIREIGNIGFNWSVVVLISKKELNVTNKIFSSNIVTTKNYKKVHKFLKELIECIYLPSFVGLDYADVKQVFDKSSKIELKRYKINNLKTNKIINNIKKEFKSLNSCFLIINKSEIFLEEINNISDKIKLIAKYFKFGARLESKLRNKTELSLFIGK